MQLHLRRRAGPASPPGRATHGALGVAPALALVLAGLGLGLLPRPLASPPAPAVGSGPTARGIVSHDGPTGRLLLGGVWRLRQDPANQGLANHWASPASLGGWRAVTVPNAWNARDPSVDSMIGQPVWYRRDFLSPPTPRGTTWLVRFESVNNRATVWLNGRRIGSHVGAFSPFELRLRGLHRGQNHLVVRTDSRRLTSDFPPAAGLAIADRPHGGWWNYGGILREVYLRPVRRVDLPQVQVIPRLTCARCAATVDVRALVHSYTRRVTRVRLVGRFGHLPVRRAAVALAPGASRLLTAHVHIAHPRLWSPAHPRLYRVSLRLLVGNRGRPLRPAGGWKLHTGVRSIVMRRGRLLLNGAPLTIHGVGLHEATYAHGGALTVADMRVLVAAARALGANTIRSHYPLPPHLYELADRAGLLAWSEVPVYRLRPPLLNHASVRRRAVRLVERNILDNGNHPSIVVWSVGNELGFPDAGQARYLRAAARAAHRLDPSRPVGLAYAADTARGCIPAFRPLDVVGLNAYFGWYGRAVPGRAGLSPYLDRLHACLPGKAVLISEFGVEANRPGPVTSKGTYAFQRDWIGFNLRVFASKPWLVGETYWALRPFWTAPRWAGGNPKPNPPWHNKAVVTRTGARKPAFTELCRAYRGPGAAAAAACAMHPRPRAVHVD